MSVNDSGNRRDNGNHRAVATDPAVLRAEIVRTRAELGETVAALAAKTDVKARASRAVADARDQATRAVTDARDQAVVVARTPLTWTFVAFGAACGALIWLAWRRASL